MANMGGREVPLLEYLETKLKKPHRLYALLPKLNAEQQEIVKPFLPPMPAEQTTPAEQTASPEQSASPEPATPAEQTASLEQTASPEPAAPAEQTAPAEPTTPTETEERPRDPYSVV